MMHWPPFSRYQMRQIKWYSIIVGLSLIVVFLMGNVITALIRNSISVKKGSYILKEGFPLFTDPKEYIRLVKDYPYNAGVRFQIHRLANGESFWDVAYQYNVSIDTIVAANPFINSLIPQEGLEIVVPAQDGVLVAINDVFDVRRMKKALNYVGRARGEYLPTVFKIISTDDIRFVFFPKAKPVIVNNSLEKLYEIKNIFQSPIRGNFSSLFGDRQHPFVQDGTFRFHNGVDIIASRYTPIHPAREGMVIFTGDREGYGNTVMLQHHEGYTTLYGHLEECKVKTGTWVTKKDIIGTIGVTGRTTGPHLHFTVMKHGHDLNPLLFIW